MSRFTLHPGRWYAMTWILPGGSWEHSPIWLERVQPRGGGQGRLEIDFYHATYPAGVRDKHYELHTLRRSSGYLLAEERASGSEEPRVVLLREISLDWLRAHFPALHLRATAAETLAAELDALTDRRPRAR